MNTLLLDQDLWDVTKDAAGNFALATAPYALAQDVASAIRTILGEVFYDDTLGIPWLDQVLGKTPALTLIKAYVVNAALAVPGVVNAICVITNFSPSTRELDGQLQFTDSAGNTQSVPLV